MLEQTGLKVSSLYISQVKQKCGLEVRENHHKAKSENTKHACDQGGVRHAEHEAESIVTFEEAKFMMVTCSAIVNYLVAEYGKHGTENA